MPSLGNAINRFGADVRILPGEANIKTPIGIRTRSYSAISSGHGQPRLYARTGFTSYFVANFRMADHSGAIAKYCAVRDDLCRLLVRRGFHDRYVITARVPLPRAGSSMPRANGAALSREPREMAFEASLCGARGSSAAAPC